MSNAKDIKGNANHGWRPMDYRDLQGGNWGRLHKNVSRYFSRGHLTLRERQVYWVCFTEILGWNGRTQEGRVHGRITLQKLMDETGLSESHACEARSNLVRKGLLGRDGKLTIIHFPQEGSSNGFPLEGSKVPSIGKNNFPDTGSEKSNSPHKKAKNKTPKDNSKDINPKKGVKLPENENSCGAAQHSLEVVAEVLKKSRNKDGFDSEAKLRAYVDKNRQHLEYLQPYAARDICMAIMMSEQRCKGRYAFHPRYVADAIDDAEGRKPKKRESTQRLTTLLSFFPS